VLFIIPWELPQDIPNRTNARPLFFPQSSRSNLIWACDLKARYSKCGTLDDICATTRVVRVGRDEAGMITLAVGGIGQGRYCGRRCDLRVIVSISPILSLLWPPQLSLTLRMPPAVSFKGRSAGEY
jgi:hypothetical protein